MLIVALYCRSLLSGIHHAYQERVLLAVEMQAGSGCSIPNRTVPYCTDPYHLVETSHKSLSLQYSWLNGFVIFSLKCLIQPKVSFCDFRAIISGQDSALY